jgi:hypothetical protein
MVTGGVTMPIIRWTPIEEASSIMYGMDPVYEDYLAQELNSWPHPEEIELTLDLDKTGSDQVPQLSYILALT